MTHSHIVNDRVFWSRILILSAITPFLGIILMIYFHNSIYQIIIEGILIQLGLLGFIISSSELSSFREEFL